MSTPVLHHVIAHQLMPMENPGVTCQSELLTRAIMKMVWVKENAERVTVRTGQWQMRLGVKGQMINIAHGLEVTGQEGKTRGGNRG